VAAVCSAPVCRGVREWARVACTSGSEAARASLGLGADDSVNELKKEIERERKKKEGKSFD
jgi:hypothetical protein